VASATSTPVNAHIVAEVDADIVGFLEVGLRSHADGCDERHPVGFVEGWYVRPEFQRRAIGRALMATAEDWARSRGARELASDTWPTTNPRSLPTRRSGSRSWTES
jgi:aminoglycoside 6'-N-acetyltransferase I